MVKFNESLAQNKTLRERIDALRRERVVFDSIYKKLERELHDKKKVSHPGGKRTSLPGVKKTLSLIILIRCKLIERVRFILHTANVGPPLVRAAKIAGRHVLC